MTFISMWTAFLLLAILCCAVPYIQQLFEPIHFVHFLTVMFYPVLSYIILFYSILSYSIQSYHILSYNILHTAISCPILSYQFLSYHIIWHIKSYPIISYVRLMFHITDYTVAESISNGKHIKSFPLIPTSSEIVLLSL